ncbi:MAG: YeeE/YedE thiosulfate transporter family protein, partial [Betaproteobacteria bacterium]|nr:YeeE/YedE thiosulfate transporter family protein [Betaproteobacteria bacterium]
LGIAAGLHMYVMKGLQLRFGVSNFGQLMKEMGITAGLSAKGTVFDPGYWYVTTQEAQWVGWVFHKLGANNMDNIYFGLENGLPNPLINPADWMSLALIGGAAVMALLSNEFKWKATTRELAIWAIIGGALMGIGSRLGLGCNVGAFFVRVSQGDVSGWMFGGGMFVGAYVGVRFFNWWTERKMAKEMAGFDL